MVHKKILVFIFILVFFLRLPSLFEPFTYGDEGIYLTLGQAMRKGVVLYREIHDNKPPMLYLLAALAGNFPTYRLILFFWSFVTVLVFYKLAKLVFPKNKLGAIISTVVFAILSSIHTFEGNVGNAENFMFLPTIVGFYLVFRGDSNQKIYWFLAGILFGLAALFKVPAAFDFLTALIFLLFLLNQKKWPVIFGRWLLLILGFSLPVLVTIIYFFSKKALNQYLIAAFSQNIPYLSSWIQDESQSGGLPLPLLGRGFLVLALIFGLYLSRKRVSAAAKLILIWFSFSLFAVLLSSRPYPHYLLQVLPSLSLSFGLIFGQVKEKVVPLLLSLALALSFFVFKFWHYPNLSYYLNFYQFAFKIKSQEEYFSVFDGQARTIYQVADYIQNCTQPQERIFIWGTQPSIYALSRRLPVGRYTTSYHIIDFDGYQETMDALKKEKPSLILKIKGEKRKFPDFESFLRSYYLKAEAIEEIEIFRRLP